MEGMEIWLILKKERRELRASCKPDRLGSFASDLIMDLWTTYYYCYCINHSPYSVPTTFFHSTVTTDLLKGHFYM